MDPKGIEERDAEGRGGQRKDSGSRQRVLGGLGICGRLYGFSITTSPLRDDGGGGSAFATLFAKNGE